MVSLWETQNRQGLSWRSKRSRSTCPPRSVCVARIRHGDQVVVGNSDLYVPHEESGDQQENFDWEVLGASRRDKRIAELFQNETRQFVVQQVQVGDAGSFTIILDSDYALEVFPNDSLSDEHWRMFKPSSDEPHFLVSGKGLETQA